MDTNTIGMTDTEIVKRMTNKHEALILFSKWFSFMGIGFLTPLTTALTQYQASEKWPHPIVWIVVLALCLMGAFAAHLSFLSGSYSDYKTKLNGGQQPPQKPL